MLEPGKATEIGVCRCPTCTRLGGGRVRDALAAALGTDVGGVSPDGLVRFVGIECGGESRTEPMVTLDGQIQPTLTPDKAAKLAQTLRSRARAAARA